MMPTIGHEYEVTDIRSLEVFIRNELKVPPGEDRSGPSDVVRKYEE